MKNFYSPSEAYFDRDFNKWVMAYWELDTWPPDPRDSGYIDEAQHLQSQREAGESWKDVKRELSRRLSLCGDDGKMCQLYYQYAAQTDDPRKWLSAISKGYDISYDEAWNKVCASLDYVSWGTKAAHKAKKPRGSYLVWVVWRKRKK